MITISSDILKKASLGDLDSFEEIYKAMSCFVYNIAYRTVNNREDAQEIAQEVFLIVYRRLKDFKEESSLKTWVYRIAVNCSINYGKKRTREKIKDSEYEKFDTGNRDSSDPRVSLGKDEHHEIIEKLMENIDPEQRECLVLRNVEGFSYKEISKMLDININTVRSRLKRGREKLLERGREMML